ncbi:MAG TPA: hypothetical protein VNI78_06655, partial [Vicinamibacterales bacterium]|nr:hypothetical protein [Vicinamibacterales bacterium]
GYASHCAGADVAASSAAASATRTIVMAILPSRLTAAARGDYNFTSFLVSTNALIIAQEESRGEPCQQISGPSDSIGSSGSTGTGCGSTGWSGRANG